MTDLEQAQAAGVAPWDLLQWENAQIAVFKDRYPVTPGHLLFVPQFNAQVTINQAFAAAVEHGEKLVGDNVCHAYNVGINMGCAAGQTVMYPHVHLIPRRTGDCADPVGGVRGVIAGQANYKQPGYQQPA